VNTVYGSGSGPGGGTEGGVSVNVADADADGDDKVDFARDAAGMVDGGFVISSMPPDCTITLG
jgi:hypothetical protein